LSQDITKSTKILPNGVDALYYRLVISPHPNYSKDVIVSYFLVTLRKPGWHDQHFYRPAYNSATVYALVAAEQGDDVFGITVVPV
jgi:hypothetical protein